MLGLTKKELQTLKRLSTPRRIQDFLDRLPINFEKRGDTHYSPRRVLKERKAHCFEGALLAATALWLAGKPPLLLDLMAKPPDDHHLVALYKVNGYYGAISKTNHAVLGYRDPIYKTLRELALSYFHECHLRKKGEKTLRFFSDAIDLRSFGEGWVTTEEDLWYMEEKFNKIPHRPFVPSRNYSFLRPATRFERKVLDARAWKRADPRT
jgi:hypothetical protein